MVVEDIIILNGREEREREWGVKNEVKETEDYIGKE